MINKLPPQSIEIEQACIGSAILSLQANGILISKTESEDFYFDKHRIIYEFLKDCNDKKILPDLVIAKTWMIKNDVFDSIGGMSFITSLFELSPKSSNIDSYIKELLDLSHSRKLIIASQDTIDKAYSKQNPEEIQTELNNQLKNIGTFKEIKIIDSKELFNQPAENFHLKQSDYIKTGITGLDEKIFGMLNSEVITLAARPSVGKTACALTIASNVAWEHEVLFFSMEMPKIFISIRLLANKARLNAYRIQHNMLDNYETESLNKAAKELCELKFNLVEKAGITAEQIDNISRRYYEQKGIKLVIVDYLQIMRDTSKENRDIRIGYNMKVLKSIAMDLHIPVLVLSQLGRAADNQTPTLSTLRESGNIENDSDKVIFIHYENEQHKLIVAKNRNGETGNVDVQFQRQFSKFI
jgi:replicative DNA helicase